MADEIQEHLARVKQTLLTGYSLKNRAEWVQQCTMLRREPFTFKGHEYQRAIIDCEAQEIVTRKCSQIGMSELQVRDTLAMVNVMPGFTVIYTLPTAAFSRTFARTRCDPVIEASPKVRHKVSTTVDSSEVKQFGDSFIYFRGTKGMTAAISVPADCLVHDEYDFSDQEVLSSYQSRLTHSPFKLKRKFSTPTVPGWGISEEFEASRQHWNMVKCCHCNHWFLPNYELHVRVPGWDKPVKEITDENLHTTRYREAKVICPECGKEPSLMPEHRELVVKNPDTANDVFGFQIQPFDAPTIITMPDLIKASTTYKRWADFVNFGLGLPAEDRETSFQRKELEALFIYNQRFVPFAYVMGIDVGQVCHVFIAGVGPLGMLDIVHAEKVPVGLLERRKDELKQQYRVRVIVMDSMPYFDMLMRLQAKDRNLWGALYSQRKDIEVYTSKIHEEEPEKGRPRIRQVDINRNRALDAVLDYVRNGGLAIRECEQHESIVSQLMDMKRVKTITEDTGEFEFAWQKSSKRNDHWHHTLLYTVIALRLLATVSLDPDMPKLFAKFEVKVDV